MTKRQQSKVKKNCENKLRLFARNSYFYVFALIRARSTNNLTRAKDFVLSFTCFAIFSLLRKTFQCFCVRLFSLFSFLLIKNEI